MRVGRLSLQRVRARAAADSSCCEVEVEVALADEDPRRDDLEALREVVVDVEDLADVGLRIQAGRVGTEAAADPPDLTEDHRVGPGLGDRMPAVAQAGQFARSRPYFSPLAASRSMVSMNRTAAAPAATACPHRLHLRREAEVLGGLGQVRQIRRDLLRMNQTDPGRSRLMSCRLWSGCRPACPTATGRPARPATVPSRG
jgi:hypothetical protein